MQFMAFFLPQITDMCISGELQYDCTKWSSNSGQINLSDMVVTLISTQRSRIPKTWKLRRKAGTRLQWVGRFPQGSPSRQHYLVFQKTPAFCKGTPRDAELRGRGLSYTICNSKDLIYRQIFKHSQLTCTAIWKPHLEGDEYTQHADEVFLGERSWVNSMKLEFHLIKTEVEKVCISFLY